MTLVDREDASGEGRREWIGKTLVERESKSVGLEDALSRASGRVG